MQRQSIGLCVGLLMVGCAGQTREAQAHTAQAPVRAAKRQVAARKPAPSKRASEAERQERQVAVAGIEGTLSSFDVRTTLEQRSKEFAACHEPRARRVPALAGSVEFAIHILRNGDVADVHVRSSDLGDRPLERCLSQVIQDAKFPPPNGGEADVTWTMLLEPAGRRTEPEQWQTDRIQGVLRKRRSALLEACDAKRAGPFTVTAYVSRSGRVLAAGVAARQATAPETIDCIADELRSWSMPKPRKRIAKVSFSLRTGA